MPRLRARLDAAVGNQRSSRPARRDSRAAVATSPPSPAAPAPSRGRPDEGGISPRRRGRGGDPSLLGVTNGRRPDAGPHGGEPRPARWQGPRRDGAAAEWVVGVGVTGPPRGGTVGRRIGSAGMERGRFGSAGVRAAGGRL
ncbi:MAG: hypothetical protein AVDCRST_MAG19-4667 [uncultured Thermomicrobiales bacterium]|uniref:Uncharacterized protein n=1 Tax=uncultured Thermomicrobiales bacterium TaxID=1645740 RepID=A0A6J4VRS5_9BACT|nr:MAG: hypothetical protein AVDCRST_MAG19-4667 [uncultured Thermomicrobiales bacterium]